MIHSKHLHAAQIKDMILESTSSGPIRYLVWEDFIDPVIYEDIEQEILSQTAVKVDIHKDEHRENKTVLLKGSNLQKIFDFFEGEKFEKYLGLFIGSKIKQEFYIDRNQLSQLVGATFQGSVAQIYEEGDFFDWHVDGPIEEGSLGAFTYYMGGYEGEWDASYGGNLELGEKEEDGTIKAYETIKYKKNTLVFIFASDSAYHRVTPLLQQQTRLSIQSTVMSQ